MRAFPCGCPDHASNAVVRVLHIIWPDTTMETLPGDALAVKLGFLRRHVIKASRSGF